MNLRPLLCASLLLTACPGRTDQDQDLRPPADLSGGGEDLLQVDLRGGVVVPPLAALEIDTLFQDCMPGLDQDRLRVAGRLTIRNNGDTPLGPLSATEGVLLDKDGMRLATFAIARLDLGTVPPSGAIEGRAFQKQAGTLMPANGCQRPLCMASARVEIPLSGATPALVAKSGLYTVNCAF